MRKNKKRLRDMTEDEKTKEMQLLISRWQKARKRKENQRYKVSTHL